MSPIADYKNYTSGMIKSMKDKLFWTDMIPTSEYESVIDYGCADGTFLKLLYEKTGCEELVGIDIDEAMLNKAKHNCPKAIFLNEQEYKPRIFHGGDFCNGRLLNLSSVIHEVYSYKSQKEIREFWNYVFSGIFKYVCIRDMCLEDRMSTLPTDQLSPYLYFGLPKQKDVNMDEEYRRRKEFVNRWGSMSEAKSMIHYLLKYRYTQNWNREVNENYLPLTYEMLLKMIPDGYEVIHSEHYMLPFLKQKIREDFEVNLDFKTHCKIIIKCNI